ncbi:diacylglycerol/lipid kinase family protein [Arthrobacter sp. UM1]|uniref:diacylglycerol/lipid kinase family protein n=1 Tax=Arthrobacter sp. UM1 TaxID=2766776 RepID=UPI001CF653E9|nr:diacylglycerol kinase family protein [Arthrobacter sp. UM1]MCB4209111.1 diacylglycerol kinase family lipid kinase [Arthrobacter sp. UM1]
MSGSPFGSGGRAAVLLLVNPSAGRGRSLRLAPAVAEALTAVGCSVTTRFTTDLDDARAAAGAAAPEALVAALGGDGLQAPVAEAVSRAGARFLPLPGGRGNDLCARLGLPRSPVAAARSLPDLEERAMDLGRVTCADGTSAPFLCTANIGFDSHANERANRSPRNLGTLTYLAAGAQTLVSYRGTRFRVELGSPEGAAGTVRWRERWSEHGWFVTVSAAGSCGGGLVLGPDARADDGLLDLAFQRDGSPLRVAETFVRSMTGLVRGASRLEFARSARARVSADEPLVVYADGDAVGPLPAEFEARGGTVRTLAPRRSRLFGGA